MSSKTPERGDKPQMLPKLNTERIARELEINRKQAEADRLFALAKEEKDKRKADSLYALAQKNQLEADKLMAENQKKQAESDKLTAEKKAYTLESQKQKEASAFQRTILYLTLGGLFCVMLLAFFIYRSRQEQKKLNVQLAEKSDALQAKAKELTEAYNELHTAHEELHQTQEEIIAQRDYIELQNIDLNAKNIKINDSIKAALTIQEALLPFENRVRTFLKDYFVLYQPRDIVSGDFYWIEKVGEEAILVVGDCTGHGVPGAFMSLIAINLLEKVVMQDEITSSAQILRNMHDLVRIVLKQENNDNESGMDMAIVKLGLKDTRTLIFAGAKRPLNYIEANNPTVMKNIMGSRKSIGGTQNEAKDFEETQLTLPANSMLYLSSDGLADQNDLNRKRLKEEPVWEALLANYAVSLEAQKQAVQILLDKHMIGTEQRDDVLLLGVKI